MKCNWFITQGLTRGLAKRKKLGKFNFVDNKNYETNQSAK
jgi:hypothetical protein